MSKCNKKLYVALLLYTYLPSVYLLIRMYVVTISGADVDVLGQMEWFDLIDEVLVTFIIHVFGLGMLIHCIASAVLYHSIQRKLLIADVTGLLR